MKERASSSPAALQHDIYWYCATVSCSKEELFGSNLISKPVFFCPSWSGEVRGGVAKPVISNVTLRLSVRVKTRGVRMDLLC